MKQKQTGGDERRRKKDLGCQFGDELPVKRWLRAISPLDETLIGVCEHHSEELLYATAKASRSGR
jgi:hypothetical protein